MSAREVVKDLVGPQLDAVRRAHDDAHRAEMMLRDATLNAAVARAHLADMLVAVTNEDAKGLRFDTEQGTIYREIKE